MSGGMEECARKERETKDNEKVVVPVLQCKIEQYIFIIRHCLDKIEAELKKGGSYV